MQVLLAWIDSMARIDTQAKRLAGAIRALPAEAQSEVTRQDSRTAAAIPSIELQVNGSPQPSAAVTA